MQDKYCRYSKYITRTVDNVGLDNEEISLCVIFYGIKL